jgi:hypothetical protein
MLGKKKVTILDGKRKRRSEDDGGRGEEREIGRWRLV